MSHVLLIPRGCFSRARKSKDRTVRRYFTVVLKAAVDGPRSVERERDAGSG